MCSFSMKAVLHHVTNTVLGSFLKLWKWFKVKLLLFFSQKGNWIHQLTTERGPDPKHIIFTSAALRLLHLYISSNIRWAGPLVLSLVLNDSTQSEQWSGFWRWKPASVTSIWTLEMPNITDTTKATWTMWNINGCTCPHGFPLIHPGHYFSHLTKVTSTS